MKKTRLSRAEQRVVIAKDAIKQLRAEIYHAEGGTYVEERFDKKLVKCTSASKLQGLLLKSKSLCSVCAKGALLLSTIRKFNTITPGEFNTILDGGINKLRPWTSNQLGLIEAVFEGYYYRYGNDIEKLIRKWRAKYINEEGELDDSKLLLGIMENIVRNHGTFRLK
jgi:hypothetical protein